MTDPSPIIDRATERSDTVRLRPATVASVNPVAVIIDGDDGSSPLGNAPVVVDMIAPGYAAVGSRVMVLFVPPQGAYVVGFVDGDEQPWLPLPLAGTWANGFVAPEYRRVGAVVKVRGAAQRSSGAATTLATLPAGFRPTRNIYVPAIGATTLSIDATTGDIVAQGATNGVDVGLDVLTFVLG